MSVQTSDKKRKEQTTPLPVKSCVRPVTTIRCDLNPNTIPLNRWISMHVTVVNSSFGDSFALSHELVAQLLVHTDAPLLAMGQ